MSLVLIVDVNILSVKCDIKTDFQKSGHIFVLHYSSYMHTCRIVVGSVKPHDSTHEWDAWHTCAGIPYELCVLIGY